MISFKNFILNESLQEEKKDITNTLKKIPKNHSKLFKNYKFVFQGGNTLKGDQKHVAYIKTKTKEICVAAPWNYSREFTILHEIGHKVWEHLNKDEKKEWVKITKNNKDYEELFSMAYANHFVKHKVPNHTKKEWDDFIHKICN